MKRTLAGVAVLATSLLVLSACSSISAGRITAKNFDPAWDQLTYNCVSYNKNGFCSLQIPQYIHHDAEYEFNLKNGKDTGWVYVPESEYSQYKIGDWYGEQQ